MNLIVLSKIHARIQGDIAKQVLNNITTAGIEIVTDKDEFDRILEQKKRPQKMARESSKWLTVEDVKILLSSGYNFDDIRQIQEAILLSAYEINDKKTTANKVIELIGKDQFLISIARSAFHWTTGNSKDGNHIHFDSSILFSQGDKYLQNREKFEQASKDSENHIRILNDILRFNKMNEYFSKLNKSLLFNVTFEIHSSSLSENVSVFPGSIGKTGMGIRHIIEERTKNDRLSLDEVTALSALILDTVNTGIITRDSKTRCEISKNGIVAIVRKDFDDNRQNWILTGFHYTGENEKKNREATETIQTVIAQYGNSDDYSYFRSQVGAVITSLNPNISQSEKKSTIQKPVEYDEQLCKKNIISWTTDDIYDEADGLDGSEIFQKYENVPVPIAVLPEKAVIIFNNLSDRYIYSGKAYFIDHMVNHHAELEPNEFQNFQDDLNSFEQVYFDPKNNSIIFEKDKNNKKYSIVLKQDFQGNLLFYKSYHYGNKTKKRFVEIDLEGLRKKLSVEVGNSSINHPDEPGLGRLLSALTDTRNITSNSNSVNKEKLSSDELDLLGSKIDECLEELGAAGGKGAGKKPCRNRSVSGHDL